jgi:predicted Zn-dependent peptidase
MGQPSPGTIDPRHPENILRFDSPFIRDFFKRLYQPERIVISVAGNVRHDHLYTDGDACLLLHRDGQPLGPAQHTHGGMQRVTAAHRDLEQTHICLGMRGLSVTDPRRFAASLLNTILGGNMSSRLFQTIREERGLAYSIYSFLTAYADTGMLGVYTAVAPKNVRACIDLIMEQVRRLKKEPVSADALNDAKAFTKGNLLMAAESPDNQMVRLAQNQFYFDRHIPIQAVMDQLDAVTSGDLLELASDLWGQGCPAITLLGPHIDRVDLAGQLDL